MPHTESNRCCRTERVWVVRLLHAVGMGIENSYVEVYFLILSPPLKPLHSYYVKACSRLGDQGCTRHHFPSDRYESDLHCGWLGLTCETSLYSCGARLSHEVWLRKSSLSRRPGWQVSKCFQGLDIYTRITSP